MDKNILHKYFDGTITEDELRNVHRWIDLAPENRDEFLRERKMYDLLTLLPGIEREKASVAPIRRRRLFFELMKAAAVALLVLGGVYAYGLLTKEEVETKEIAMQSVSVPAGQRINIVLSDGTNVWLNARTKLKYPALFDGKERRLELDGEAFFDVVADVDKPFVVTTSKGEVEAVGTEFNVRAYNNSEGFETTLMSGKVSVSLAGNPAAKTSLAPSQKTVLTDGALIVEQVDDFTRYRWREGLICFKNDYFAEIMKELENCYDVEIVINNKRIKSHLYTGKFRYVDGVDYALKVLQKDINFRFRRDNNQSIIYIE